VGNQRVKGWFVNKITIYGHNKGELRAGVKLHHCLYKTLLLLVLLLLLLASRLSLRSAGGEKYVGSAETHRHCGRLIYLH
jgi:hypothetical protein